jgi:hypothetical protein
VPPRTSSLSVPHTCTYIGSSRDRSGPSSPSSTAFFDSRLLKSASNFWDGGQVGDGRCAKQIELNRAALMEQAQESCHTDTRPRSRFEPPRHRGQQRSGRRSAEPQGRLVASTQVQGSGAATTKGTTVWRNRTRTSPAPGQVRVSPNSPPCTMPRPWGGAVAIAGGQRGHGWESPGAVDWYERAHGSKQTWVTFMHA